MNERPFDIQGWIERVFTAQKGEFMESEGYQKIVRTLFKVFKFGFIISVYLRKREGTFKILQSEDNIPTPLVF